MSHTAETEREKYRETWQLDQYRHISPGELLVERALKALEMPEGSSVVDLGAGTGRASLALAKAGMHVLLVDIAENCRDHEAQRLPFLRACLWDLPELSANYVYCCDVLEHIPTLHVPAAIAAAARTAPRAFFQVALFEDRWAGRTLHLTVESEEWWRLELGRHYRVVSGAVDTSRGRRLIVTCAV